jgi:8-oxo-dGTP diphosphatase
LGENCKYNGGNNENFDIKEILCGFETVSVCPEVMGGLETPRSPSERLGDKVINREGKDVTENFKTGAEKTLGIALENKCRLAVLKARSPSCSPYGIYDGSFSGKVVSGRGVTSELLIKNGIEVYSEEDAEFLKTRLSMKETTLCYIEKDGKVLMLQRNKKKNDYNEGKWIGVGGKLEGEESPDECLIREVKEETGLDLCSYKKRGLVFFYQDGYGELMHLYTAESFSAEFTDCSEGELHWIDKYKVKSLPTWEGDRKFLDIIYGKEEKSFFNMHLYYNGDKLTDSKISFFEE